MSSTAQALHALLLANASGELACRPDGGYLRRLSDAECVALRGVTRAIARVCYPDFRHWRYRFGGQSSRAKGSAFHQRVYHSLFCAGDAQRCSCERKFGAPCGRPLKRGSKMHGWVLNALRFVRNSRIRPLAGELIVAGLPGMATQVDMLGARDGRLVNVSWKTGYDVATLEDSRSVDRGGKSAPMRGAPHLVNCELNHHRLQVAVENHMLRVHGAHVAASYIVYVSATADGSVHVVDDMGDTDTRDARNAGWLQRLAALHDDDDDDAQQ